MIMNKFINDLRKKDISELNKLLKENKVSQLEESLKFRLGKAKPAARMKNKVAIAQILTVLKEKEILNG